jgi:hypothetical protein
MGLVMVMVVTVVVSRAMVMVVRPAVMVVRTLLRGSCGLSVRLCWSSLLRGGLGSIRKDDGSACHQGKGETSK